jgi:hypothetical protein
VDALVAGLEGRALDWDPAHFTRKRGLADRGRRAMRWNTGQEVISDVAPVGEDNLAPAWLEALDPAPGMEADPLGPEEADDGRTHRRSRDRHRRGLRAVDVDLAPPADAPAAQLVVEQHGCLVRRGGALVRQAATVTTTRPPGNPSSGPRAGSRAVG